MSDSSTQAAAKSDTTSTFVSALVLNIVIFAIEIIAFTILRKRFRAIYEPRTFIPAERKRQTGMGGMLGWPIAVFKADYTAIQFHNGLDAYFFVRFLRMMVKIFLPIWIISWIILFPVYAAGKTTGLTGLSIFTFANVSTSNQPRYGASLVLAWIFTAWILWNLRSEMQHFIVTRQQYLTDEEHRSLAQANTVLITGIPLKYMSETALERLFSHLPGGVVKVWLNRDLKELPKLYERRLKACGKLESAETSLIHTATKLHNKRMKQETKAQKKGNNVPPMEGLADPEGNGSLAAKLVPTKKRPSHRLPLGFMPFSLPLVGQKVDSITWAREEINNTEAGLATGHKRLYEDVEATAQAEANGGMSRAAMKEQMYPPISSAFVRFNTQIAAHMASQVLLHHEPYRMAETHIELAPEDVIWGNLGMNPYESKIRMLISYAITAALIILWAFPVAFVGSVSNLSALCAKHYSWLAWFCGLPSAVIGIISGILPPVLLAVLMSLVPIILRLLAKFEGIPRRTGVELSLMTRYFLFVVIHSFLIVTLSSGIMSALPGLLSDPTNIPSLLATSLPGAFIFFLTYILLQGLSNTAGGFLTIVPLAIYYVKLYLLGSTPRSVYKIKYTLRSVAWGTLFPTMSLLVVIGIVYSVVAPVINGFVCAAFFLFYQLYKYLFLWQYEQPAYSDTGGLFFPKAITHVFVGIYLGEVMLAALFFLATNTAKKHTSVAEGALMIVLIIFTAVFHLIMSNSFAPLKRAIPLSIVDRPQNGGSPTTGANNNNYGPRGTTSTDNDKIPLQEQSQAGNGSSMRGPEKAPIGPNGERAVAAPGGRPQQEGEYDPAGEMTDFDQPAMYLPQRIVWLPQDTLNLGEAETRANLDAGINTTTAHAIMDAKGHVDIDGPPPDDI